MTRQAQKILMYRHGSAGCWAVDRKQIPHGVQKFEFGNVEFHFPKFPYSSLGNLTIRIIAQTTKIIIYTVGARLK